MASLLSYALTDVASVKELLGIASGNTTYDNLITRKINQATEMIENYCNRRFAATTYTDIEYDASNTDQIVLKQRPVIELTSFGTRNTTQNQSDWDTVGTEDYFTDLSAGIIKINFTTIGHWNQYRVTYQAGYVDIPSDLAEACATIAAFFVDNGVSSTSIKRKQEGQREVEYFDQGAKTSSDTALFAQLGILGTLNAYANYPISEK